MADSTYIEPIEWRTVEKIIEIEKPDALLPTMGGQTALNCALDLERHGVIYLKFIIFRRIAIIYIILTLL
jgi:carbamoyl-phosphate synthase large subunit